MRRICVIFMDCIGGLVWIELKNTKLINILIKLIITKINQFRIYEHWQRLIHLAFLLLNITILLTQSFIIILHWSRAKLLHVKYECESVGYLLCFDPSWHEGWRSGTWTRTELAWFLFSFKFSQEILPKKQKVFPRKKGASPA